MIDVPRGGDQHLSGSAAVRRSPWIMPAEPGAPVTRGSFVSPSPSPSPSWSPEAPRLKVGSETPGPSPQSGLQRVQQVGLVFKASKVEHERSVPDPADDRERERAQGGRELLDPAAGRAAASGRRAKGDSRARPRVDRKRTAPDAARALDYLHAFRDLAVEHRRDALRAGPDLGFRPHQPAQGGQLPDQPLRVRIQRKQRPERGEGELVDAQGPLHRVAPYLGYEAGVSGDDSRLRAAEQLVAAEGHEVRPAGEGFPGGRFVGEAEPFERDQHAASEVVHPGHAPLAGEGPEPGRVGGGGEPLHHVVAGMHGHHRPGPLADRAREVFEVGPIGGPDLDEAASGPAHDLREPERAADLDELAARDRNLAAEREGVENEQDGGRVVVHHGRRLGPGEPRDPPFDVGVSFAALARSEVELEVHGGAGGLGHCLDCHLGQLGPSEIGVQDRAGEVQNRAQGRYDGGARAVQRRFGHHALRVFRRRAAVPTAHLGSELADRPPHRFHHEFASVLARASLDLGPLEYPIDARETRQGRGALVSSPHGSAGSRRARARGRPRQACSRAAGKLTPVPPIPQYPHGFFARYCWW